MTSEVVPLLLHTSMPAGMPPSRVRWGCAQAFIDAHPGRTLQKKWVTERVRELAEHNGRRWVLRAAQAAAAVAENPTINPSSTAALAPAASGAAASRAEACVPDQAPAPDQAAEPSPAPSPAQAGPMDSFVLRRVPSCFPDGSRDWGPARAALREGHGDLVLGSWKAHEHAEAEHTIPGGPIQPTGESAGARSCGSAGRPDVDGEASGPASGAGTELAAPGDGSGSGAAPSCAVPSCIGPAGGGACLASAEAGAAGGSGGGMLSDAELAAADDHVRTCMHSTPHAPRSASHALRCACNQWSQSMLEACMLGFTHIPPSKNTCKGCHSSEYWLRACRSPPAQRTRVGTACLRR